MNRKVAKLPLVATMVVACALALSSSTHASTPQKKTSAREQFDRAESARQSLEAKPLGERKLADYQAVLKLYRNVTILAPTIHQAPDSLFHSAALNQEMAARFPKDASAYRAEARRLYQSLLKEYPQTRYRKESNQALALMEMPDAPETPAPTKPVLMPVSAPAPPAAAKTSGLATVSSIREWATPSYTRVVIDVDDEVKFEAGRIANPDRIYFDLHNTKLLASLKDHVTDVDGDGLLKKIRLGVNRVGITRVVLEVGQVTTYSAFLLPNPYRLVIDIQGATKPLNTAVAAATPPPAPEPVKTAEIVKPKRKPAPVVTLPIEHDQPPVETVPVEVAKELDPPPSLPAAPDPEIPATNGPTSKPVFNRVRAAAPVLAPTPTLSGQRSLTRALGLKIGRIVIDAGHGGHDTGTIGPSGYTEKELTLDVAQRLGQLVQERLGSEVVYTRDDDTFIPLEMRTAIANQKQADLFVSIHANASRDQQARGIETYYLSFSASQEALDVAARENAVSEKSIHELQDLVKKISLYEKVEESKEFAADVQKAMYTALAQHNTALRNRGVRKAPFVVLIGANMPSILAEISFVSNPQDEKLLRKPEYRQKIAESLFHGIQHYSNSLGGVKVASQRGDAPAPREPAQE